MQDFIKMKVSTKALRSIDRMGGLDNYLMKSSDDKLGLYGRALRRSIIDKKVEKREENANV